MAGSQICALRRCDSRSVGPVKILLSVYACEPGKGSEQEVGLRVMLAAAQRHDVWVLTRENSITLLEKYLADFPVRDRIRLHGIDVAGPMRRIKRAGQPGLHLYYDAWQRLAARRGRRTGPLGRFRPRASRYLRHVLGLGPE